MRLAEPDLSTTSRILSLAAADDFPEKQFQADEAPFIMEVLQKELDRICTQKDSQRLGRKYLKSIHHLNRVHGVLPPSMFLTGLTRESKTAVAGGGFADVWIGRLDKQRVCIKVLRFFQHGSEREKLHKTLSKEALLWRQLNHPNILPFLGVNTELFAPSFCIVSPWMSNGDIIAYARNSSLNLDAKLQHTIEIAEGLLYLHELDPPVVHGDIKGANVLISDDHRCCLADFGLSVLDTHSMNPTVTAAAQGSLRWLAPEFINPTPTPTQGRLTPRDIYAFGCTVFEILTGQPPFSHLNLDITVAIDVLKGVRPVLPPTAIPKDIVFKLIRVLLDSCWAEEIPQRPNVRVVLDFLNQVYDLLHLPEDKLESFSILPVLNGLGITRSDSKVIGFLGEMAADTSRRAVSIHSNNSSLNGGILPSQSDVSLANLERLSKGRPEPHSSLLSAPSLASPTTKLPLIHGNSWSRKHLTQTESSKHIAPVSSFSQSNAKSMDDDAWESRPTRHLLCFVPMVKRFRQSSPLSCVECSRRKLKCNAAVSFPCSCCVKKGLPCGLPTVLTEPEVTYPAALRKSFGFSWANLASPMRNARRHDIFYSHSRPTPSSAVTGFKDVGLLSQASGSRFRRATLSVNGDYHTNLSTDKPDNLALTIPASMPIASLQPLDVNQYTLDISDDQPDYEEGPVFRVFPSSDEDDYSNTFPEGNRSPERPEPLSWTNTDLFQAWHEYRRRQTQTPGRRRLPPIPPQITERGLAEM